MFIKYQKDNYRCLVLDTLGDKDTLAISTPQNLNLVFRLSQETLEVQIVTSKVESKAKSFIRSPIVRDKTNIIVLAIQKRLEPSYSSVINIARDILIVLGIL